MIDNLGGEHVMRWQQGRDVIEGLIKEGRLQRVAPSRDQAEQLIFKARSHLKSADAICRSDPEGGYALAYDAARRALAAILENQGLRATSRGGHIALQDAVRAQLDPPMGKVLRPFNQMRRLRNEVEYPPTNRAPKMTPEDVLDDLEYAEALIDLAERVLDQMSPF